MKFNLIGENELNVCPKSGEMLTMHINILFIENSEKVYILS